MKENFENKYNTLLWRVAAVLFSLLMVVIFFVRSFVLGSGFHDLDIITIPIFIALSIGALAAAVLLIIFPFQFYIYAVFCWLWGVLRLVDGGSIAGFCVYLLGWLFAFQQGFLKTHRKVKIGVGIAILCITIATQYRYGFALVARNLLLYFEFFLILAVSLLLAWPQIQKLRAITNENVHMLSVIGFSQTDIQILQKILAGDKYESIALDCGLSINTMKHRVQKLFEKLQVNDRTTFVTKYANRGAFLN